MSRWICRLCEAGGETVGYPAARLAYERHYKARHWRALERERRKPVKSR